MKRALCKSRAFLIFAIILNLVYILNGYSRILDRETKERVKDLRRDQGRPSKKSSF